MTTFVTDVFLAILTLAVIVQLWLARRHVRYVAAHRDAVPTAFRDTISLTDHQKAADYTVAKTHFGMIESVYSAALLLVWTLGGGLAWLERLGASFGWGSVATGTVYLGLLFLIIGALELPFQVYQTFILEQQFGFNRTSAATFAGDLVKQVVLAVVLGGPLVAVVLWLMTAAGAWWWLWAWGVWTGFSLLLLWLYPTVIAPWFNKFHPLKSDALYTRIQALLDRTGFKSNGIFVMDGSRRSAHGNAYFTGFGRNKRIVFFDTLLDTLAETEIEAVLAHELGHFKLKHVVKRMVLIFASSFAGLALLGYLVQKPWFYAGLGVPHGSAYAALALFLLVGPVFGFFIQPLAAWASRKHEFEADAYAATQTAPRELIHALVKLYQKNAATLTPDPLHSVFYDSHPPAPVRIAHLQRAGV